MSSNISGANAYATAMPHTLRLVNRSDIGMLTLADNGAPTKIAVLHGDMSQTLFESPKQK